MGHVEGEGANSKKPLVLGLVGDGTGDNLWPLDMYHYGVIIKGRDPARACELGL